MNERLLTALIHSWIGLGAGFMICLPLRRATAATRCWVWRAVLIKGLLALLVIVPIVVEPSSSIAALSPFSSQGEKDGMRGQANLNPSLPETTIHNQVAKNP